MHNSVDFHSIKTNAIPESEQKVKIYPVRWYILTLFSLNCFLQSFEILGFSAVPDSFQQYYIRARLTVADLNLFLSIGAFSFVVFVFLLFWIEALTNDLRFITLISTISLFLSTLLRMFPTWINSLMPFARTFFLVASLLNNLGNAFSYSLPAKVSATWFPASERSVATGLGSQSNPLGVALSFLLGPILVRKASDFPNILYLHLGLQFLCTFLIIAYFPKAPPTPPSFSQSAKEDDEAVTQQSESVTQEPMQPLETNNVTSSTTKIKTREIVKMKLKQSLKPLKESIKLFIHPQFMVLACLGGLQSGATQAWSSNIPYFYMALGSTESLGAYFAFAHLFLTVIGALLVSWLSTKLFRKKDKLLLLILFGINVVICLLFLLFLPIGKLSSNNTQSNVAIPLQDRFRKPIVPVPLWVFSFFVALFGIVTGAPLPLVFEVGAEETYPVSESISGGFITAWISIGYFFVLLIYSFVDLPWMTLTSFITIVASTLMIFLMKVQYKRSQVEEEKENEAKRRQVMIEMEEACNEEASSGIVMEDNDGEGCAEDDANEDKEVEMCSKKESILNEALSNIGEKSASESSLKENEQLDNKTKTNSFILCNHSNSASASSLRSNEDLMRQVPFDDQLEHVRHHDFPQRRELNIETEREMHRGRMHRSDSASKLRSIRPLLSEEEKQLYAHYFVAKEKASETAHSEAEQSMAVRLVSTHPDEVFTPQQHIVGSPSPSQPSATPSPLCPSYFASEQSTMQYDSPLKHSLSFGSFFGSSRPFLL